MADRFEFVDIHINGRHIKLNYSDSPYKITSFLGTGATEYQVNITQNAQRHGGIIKSAAFLPREMQLQFIIEPFSKAEKLRQELIHTFTPMEDFTLYVNRGGVKRRIHGRVTSFDIDNVRLFDPIYAELEMVCDDPFFKDGEDTIIRFLEYGKLFNAPIIIPQWGLTAGMIRTSTTAELNNTGDIDVGILAVIQASGGRVVNPTISLNDRYFKVLYTMEIGDIITINTIPNFENLHINRIESYDYELNSEFFTVPIGENTIMVSADEETVTNTSTTVIYANNYFGV